jgi:hypothetical protein
MIVKGLLAAILTGAGIFAVYAGADSPVANAAHAAQECPDMGLAALLRPMQH